MDFLVKLLTGIGVAIPCGLNPYLPVLIISIAGLGNKYTLTQPYDNLGNWGVVIVLAILVGVDVVAGKIPQIDRLYTNLNYIIRPVAGALVFAATVPDSQLNSGISFILGLALALITYLVQIGWRHEITSRSLSMRVLQPVFSTAESGVAAALSLASLVVGAVGGPLAIILLIGFTVWYVSLRRTPVAPLTTEPTEPRPLTR